MNEDLENQIQRLHAAIGVAAETNPGRLRARIVNTAEGFGFDQDFRAGQTVPELANKAFSLISIVANFREHLKKWARENGKDASLVDRTVKESDSMKIVLDLADAERHPHPRRNGGQSGKDPRLENIDQVMQLKPSATPGSSVIMQLGGDGVHRISGNGSARAVVTGDIVSGKGERIGDLQAVLCNAIECWRSLMVALGAL